MTAQFTTRDIAQSSVEPAVKPSFEDVSWNGFTVKRYTRVFTCTRARTMTHHTLQFNLGPPTPFSWKSRDALITEYCTTGAVVELLSHGDVEELQWEGDYNTFEIAFEPSFIDNLLEKENFRFRHQRNIGDSLLTDIATKLYDYTFADSTTQKLHAESLGITCAIHLATAYSNDDKKIYAPKGKLSAFQLKNVIEFVCSKIQGILTLEELAAATHLSVFHFSRLFKNTVGVSPYQFVLGMKIEHAKKLIRRRAPISDIAYTLGFTDSAHFCNAFKKYTGLSPLQFLMK
jgi:AraC family transcriptional regulator